MTQHNRQPNPQPKEAPQMGDITTTHSSGITVADNSGTITIGGACYCRFNWRSKRLVCHHCRNVVMQVQPCSHVCIPDPGVAILRHQVRDLQRQVRGLQIQVTRLLGRPAMQACNRPHNVVNQTYQFGGGIAWWLVLLVGVIAGLLTALLYRYIPVPNTLDWRVGLPMVAGVGAAVVTELVAGVVAAIRR